MNKQIKGDLLVTLAMLIFGSYALFIRLLPNIPVVSFLFAMQVVGMVSFFFMALRQGFPKTDAKAKWLLLALALSTTANDLVYFYAFRLTSIANASVGHQLVSVFLLFLAPMFLGEKTKRNEFISLAIALMGTFILFGQGIRIGSDDFLGITLGILSALFYAIFVLIYRYMPAQGYPVSFMNFWRYTLSTMILLPFVSKFGGFGVLRENFFSLFAFGMLFAVIASYIHNSGISKTRSLHVSIIGKSEPVIATAYAFFFLHETPSFYAILGGMFIIWASVWLAFEKPEAGE